VHRNTDSSLDRAAYVVAVPGHTLGNVREDTGCSEETSDVFHRVIVCRNEHDEPNDTVK
jgi:hypothetical protein